MLWGGEECQKEMHGITTFHGFIFASLASRSFATVAKMLLIEVIGRELAELDEGRSQEAMDNFFA